MSATGWRRTRTTNKLMRGSFSVATSAPFRVTFFGTVFDLKGYALLRQKRSQAVVETASLVCFKGVEYRALVGVPNPRSRTLDA